MPWQYVHVGFRGHKEGKMFSSFQVTRCSFCIISSLSYFSALIT